MHVSFRVNCTLDLWYLAKHLKNATYDPKKIRAVVIRLKNPKSTTLVFSTGKAFTVGAACEDEAKLATKKVAKMILKLYPQVRYSNYQVNLFTGVKKFGWRVRLTEMSLWTGSVFEPELFPGLIYWFPDNQKCVGIVFSTGVVTLVGPKTSEELIKRLDSFKEVLAAFFGD